MSHGSPVFSGETGAQKFTTQPKIKTIKALTFTAKKRRRF
jgi:hypothetical protein